MLINTNIKTTTKWLGDKKNPEKQIRVFERSHNNSLSIPDTIWRNNTNKAAADLSVADFDKQSLRFQFGILADTEIYTRVYNKTSKEKFEAIPENQIIELKLVYNNEENKNITTTILKNILKHVGEFYGFSPWGNKFGYGRFEIYE